MKWAAKALNKHVMQEDDTVKMTAEMKELALYWYAEKDFDLQTIADHFNITVENLKAELNTTK